MKSKDAKKEFERHLAQRRARVAELTPAHGIDAMLSFYRDVRAADCNGSDQGDMLLYEWGVYDWGQGPRFELGLTRQLIKDGAEDEDIDRGAVIPDPNRGADIPDPERGAEIPAPDLNPRD